LFIADNNLMMFANGLVARDGSGRWVDHPLHVNQFQVSKAA